MKVSTKQHLHPLKECSGCVGFCVELGERFFNYGIVEVSDVLVPMLEESGGEGISPCVLPAYATLMWFSQQLRNNLFSISM